MGPKPRVDIFFDVMSPYSWIGFEAITRYSARWPIDLRYRPFSFPGVIKATGNTGAPMLVPMKARYLREDLPRAAKHWGIDIRIPPNYDKLVVSKSAVGVQRLLASLEEFDPERIPPIARAFWKRLYTENKNIFGDSDILEVLAAINERNPESCVEVSKSEASRKRLRDNTTEAIAAGCFGAPWIHVYTHNGVDHFFGSDRMPMIADSLGLFYEGPIKH